LHGRGRKQSVYEYSIGEIAEEEI
jgi:hypothetical protein